MRQGSRVNVEVSIVAFSSERSKSCVAALTEGVKRERKMNSSRFPNLHHESNGGRR